MITLLQQAEQYKRFAQEKYQAHQVLAGKTRQMHALLGLLIVLFAAMAVSIFFSAGMEHKINAFERAIAGLLLILAAILAAILISFRLSATVQRHTRAAAAYDAIRYRLGMFLLIYPDLRNADARQFALKEMIEIVDRLTSINMNAPVIPGKVWQYIRNDDTGLAPTKETASFPVA